MIFYYLNIGMCWYKFYKVNKREIERLEKDINIIILLNNNNFILLNFKMVLF